MAHVVLEAIQAIWMVIKWRTSLAQLLERPPTGSYWDDPWSQWIVDEKLIWVWVNTYRYIFSGMNIHLPAILGFTRYQGFDPSPYSNTDMSWDVKFRDPPQTRAYLHRCEALLVGEAVPKLSKGGLTKPVCSCVAHWEELLNHNILNWWQFRSRFARRLRATSLIW